MGVNGLTPFLQKICPHVLKKLPNRFQTLKGKRLVIDGTLITQRFHFVQNGHPYQHVLGWYRLLEELQDNGVSAVCVFDGKERSAAKAREIERRRQTRFLTSARSSIEEERFQRLNGLKAAVEQFQEAEPMIRSQISQSLRDSAFGVEDGSSALLEESRPLEGEEAEEPEPKEPPVAPPITKLTPGSSLEERPFPRAAFGPSQIATTLRSLFLSYKASVAKLVTLSIDSSDSPPTAVPGATAEDERNERIMTKAQYQLTVDEGKFWREATALLMAPVSVPGIAPALPRITQNTLDDLVEQSHVMAESFHRRTNAPTALTYRQSKEIIKAMGVPCIEANGAVEAEALASSMVLSGRADYVVSEDTDVLIYDAPLIRNITSRLEPLVIVSGPEVRSALNMDRDSFIDFALLLGTDFSQRIRNLGPQRAYKFIQCHASIEPIVDLVESDPKYALKLPRKAYLTQINIARLIFQNLPPLPPKESLVVLEKDDKAVVDILERYQLGRLLYERHCDGWDSEAHYRGNYFSDNPYAL